MFRMLHNRCEQQLPIAYPSDYVRFAPSVDCIFPNIGVRKDAIEWGEGG
jgi:hypothetical protein